jgi:hypothetical protein
VSPNPRQGGTAPEPRGVRSAAPPTWWAGAPDRRTGLPCRPSGRPGSRPPCRPSGRPGSRPPCRLTPVGRHGLNRPPGRCRRVRLHTAVPPYPHGAARRLTGRAVRCGRSARDRRAALSPWGGTALTGHLVVCWRVRLHTAVPSLPRGTARRQVRRAVPRWAHGLDSRVALGGGRRATRPELPRRSDPWAARPGLPCRLVPVGRHGLIGRPALPGGAGRGRVVLRWGERATRRPRSCRSHAAERRGVGPPCRPPCTRGRHGAHRNDAHLAGFPKRVPSGVDERLR